MRSLETSLPGVLILEPKIFHDNRGYFFESFNSQKMEALGVKGPFVQDNHSHSKRGVLRGLHYQVHRAQGKLVRVISGEIFDVAVDIRRHSPYFGKWFGSNLSAASRQMLWVPPGFAHGFYVLTEIADVVYKTTDFYFPQHERTIHWKDPALGVRWPLQGQPILSDKDRAGIRLAEAEVFV